MNVAEFSVRQTVLVNVLFFVCLLGGLAAWQRIPVEFFPEINLNQVVVTTVWSGASAEEVERLVTQKLEEEIGRVSKITEMRSDSGANLSTIRLDLDEFLNEIEYESALNDVRAAIDRVPDLPDDAEEPVVAEVISSEFWPVVMIAIVDKGGLGESALREISRDVETRVERIPGVNKAEVRGLLEREVRVVVDRDAAARFGLTALDVADRIQRQNLNLPAGTFPTGSGESTLRARGDYESVDSILDTVVRDDTSGVVVRLGEIARIEEGLEKARFRSRMNGYPAQMVSITKRADADVVDLVASVDDWIELHRPQLPEGVELLKTLDTAEFVSGRMSILAGNLATGVLLVIAILWFTIGFRNSMLVSIAIPFSFLTAMILFPMLDITINATTLTGMLLVSGMLVDDAIIVIENIYRHIEAGVPLREAVLQGTREVTWPVVAAVMTTCAAFAPLLLVGGTGGKFVSILPKAVLVCLVASLFECLLILPAHYLDFGSRRAPGAGPEQSGARGRLERLRGRVDAGLARMRDGYGRALDLALAHRTAFGTLMVAFLFFTCGRASHLAVDLFPGEFSSFNVMLETPPSFSLEQTDAVVGRIESEIEPFRGESLTDYSTIVGTSQDTNYDRLFGNNLSMSFLSVRSALGGAGTTERVLNDVQAHLSEWSEAHPEGIVELRVAAEQDGPPIGPPVEVRIQGDDYQLAKSIALEYQEVLRAQPGVFNVEDDLRPGPPEVRLVVDEERASRFGVRFEALARALRAANDGVIASSFRDPSRGEDMDIRVLLEERQRRDLRDLLNVKLQSGTGTLIRLRDVADVEITRGYRSYRRYDERRSVTVTASIDEEVTSSLEVNRALQAGFADIEARYPQIDVRYAGEFAETGEAFRSLGRIFPVALVAIYMILAALFRSYSQPLVVIVAIPFAFAGVVLGVDLLGYDISFVLMYATIGLTGVVVNDSLVMVDFINRARADGMELMDAIRLSGVRRFRPILLTTLTTVIALLPMALGVQGESKTYGPFAAAIAIGLLVAMTGTLFAVPLGYGALVLGQDRAARWWRRRRDHDPWPASKPEAPPVIPAGGGS